jgi:ribosomal protein L29
MKRNLVKELPLKSKNELQKLLTDLKAELAKIRVNIKAKRMKDVSLAGKKRKEIAQILTVINTKEK